MTHDFKISANQLYELTFNPDDKHQYFGSDIRHIRSRDDTKQLFESLSVKYLLYQEISVQQHSNKSLSHNRVHYHGVIRIVDPFTFVLTDMYKLTRMGDYQLNEYRSNGEFLEYATKQAYLYKHTMMKQMLSNCTMSEYWRPLLDSIKNGEQNIEVVERHPPRTKGG